MTAPVRPFDAGWAGAALVCGECSRKLGGGFGKDGTRPLARQLRKGAGLAKGKKGRAGPAGVIETRCLGLCPKRRVVVIDTASPDRWLLVAPGTPVEQVVASLPSLAGVDGNPT